MLVQIRFTKGVLQPHATSKISIHGDLYVKKGLKFHEFRVIPREVCVLKLLQQFEWCPRLVTSNETTIVTKYAGDPITDDNVPLDANAQFVEILNDMASVGVRHNDIIFPCNEHMHKIEVMVKDGRLMLLDFGWATVNGVVPCNVSQRKFVDHWTPCPDKFVLGLVNEMVKKRSKELELKSSVPRSALDDLADVVLTDNAIGLGIDDVCLETWADWMNKIDIQGDSYKGGGYTDGAGLYRRGMWTYIRVPKANSRLIKTTLHKWGQPKVPVTFVFVRHPIDRFISAYGQTEYLMSKMNLRPERRGALKFENHPRGQVRAEIFLVEFLDKHTDWHHFCDDNKPQTDFAKKCYHGGVGHHLCRTVEVDANRSGWKSASTSKRGRNPVYVGKMETWDESIKALAKVAGVDISVELFNGVNKHSEETKFSAGYKQDLRDVLVRLPHLKLLLEAHFRVDMCLFGYDATPACTPEDTAILESWFAAAPELVFL